VVVVSAAWQKTIASLLLKTAQPPTRQALASNSAFGLTFTSSTR
jgi:hypothetical protein